VATNEPRARPPVDAAKEARPHFFAKGALTQTTMDEDWVNVDEPKQGYKPPKSVDDGKRQLTDLATKDNGPVFVSISVTEPVKVSKDGEKYVAYVVNTEVRLSIQFLQACWQRFRAGSKSAHKPAPSRDFKMLQNVVR
jgi:hypothetical protein